MKPSAIFALFLFCTWWLVAANAEVISQVRDMYPSLSPDGLTVVFQSNRSGTNQIWKMNRDGSGAVQLTHDNGNGAETPVWSPDGRLIAYASYLEDGNNDVFVMQADGSDKKRVTNGPGYDGHPHWSADGSRVVFNSDRDTPDRSASWSDRWHDIWSARVDGSDLTKHTDCKSVCTYGSFSPNGQFVLYRKVDNTPGTNWRMEADDKNSEIYVARRDGSDPRNIASHPAFDGWPLWSPVGNWIVFASNRSGPAMTSHLWRVRPDGSDLKRLTKDRWGYAQPSWTASGDALLAYRFEETAEWEAGGIVVVNLPPE